MFFLDSSINMNMDLPTIELLRLTYSLSIHQMAALHTIKLGLHILRTKKPAYLYDMMTENPRSGRQSDYLLVPTCRLNITHKGFINQSIRLINKLPEDIRSEMSLFRQKKAVKVWAVLNIKVKL